MTGNRVEELEGEVKELRATVSGLTDELVETKERLRLIEDHFGPELDDIINGKVTRTEARSELSGQSQQRDPHADVVEASPDEEPEPEPEPTDAEPEPEPESADEAKAPEEEAEEESAGSDDIIVA